MTSANSLLPAVLNPGVIFMLGAFLVLALPSALRRPVSLGVIALSAWQLATTPIGDFGQVMAFNETLTLTRLDALSRIFAIVFHIAAALNVLYSWRTTERTEAWAALAYPGAALGGVLAGDWITLFVWWELAALTSAFLVIAPGTLRTYKATMRYLIPQMASGVLLLGGAVIIYRNTGIIDFNLLSLRDADGAILFGPLLVLIGFGIKSAFPLLHNWVQDAYPKSTIGGTVMLSIFTTKLAVYALARGFAGTHELVWIGCVMTIFPIFFALIENDLRKVLCYSINNQVGFMVVGIGVGTAISVNGAVGYAFTNIIFESLLFMAVGAAMFRTGTSKATELGGLYRTMPLTMVFCIVGALSISAFPGFAGFVTKGLIIEGAAEMHIPLAWLVWGVLLFASAGVLEHAGIKIPYFTFFAHDSGKRPKDAPPEMMLAMAISAVLCVAIGLVPGPLYALLPYQDVMQGYNPYTGPHLVEQFQLLLFAVLAFALLIRFRLYPPEVPSTNLDFDWVWRVPGRAVATWFAAATGTTWSATWSALTGGARAVIARVYELHGPEGGIARSWPVGLMAVWTAVLLSAVMVLAFLAH